MSDITFGTALQTVTDVAGFARRAEELGFDLLGCGEHVMFHGPVGNTFISLSVAAGATQRIRLLSSIVLLPLYPAALAAKLGAALDVASNGRYNFGVGVGGEFPKEFEACGVPVKQRGARTNEALEVITRLWTERDVTFHGRFTTTNEVTISPAPVQKPHPPIWVAGRRDAAMKRAARYANGWLPYMYTPEQLHDSIETITRYREEFGRDMADFNPGVFIFTTVHRDGRQGPPDVQRQAQHPVRPGLHQAGAALRPGRHARRNAASACRHTSTPALAPSSCPPPARRITTTRTLP